MITLREYQRQSVDAVVNDFRAGEKRVMLVVPGGGGKTLIMSELCRVARGRCLILADAQLLVEQAASEYAGFALEDVAIEMGQAHNHYPDGPPPQRVVVGSTQTMANRTQKYDREHFSLILLDEAHKNSLGDQVQMVLSWFSSARVVGLTATPFRSDSKSLGDFFTKTSYEIGLDRLIREGSLVPIKIKSVPLEVDLTNVKSVGGDYSRSDIDNALDPILNSAAECLVEHAAGRSKIVVFLPLVKTSKRFVEILGGMGVKAVHVDGEDDSALTEFTEGEARVICNACKLTTGWNYPPADCIMVLRATKSLALFQQCALRGTRLSPATGKKDMLLLDPLYITDDHKLITPASLMARSEEEGKAMMEKVKAEPGDEHDLLDLESDAEAIVAKALEARVAAQRKKKMRLVDVLEFTVGVGDLAAARYQPEFDWEKAPPDQGTGGGWDRRLRGHHTRSCLEAA